MKSNILTIMKKEFARFFGDKRMLVSTVFLPGIMIYVVYSFMGTAMVDMFSADKNHIPEVYAVNMPVSVKNVSDSLGFKIENISSAETNGIKEKLSQKEADLLMIFPDGFDLTVEQYDVKISSASAPNIEIYYNSANENSDSAYRSMISALDDYESSLSNLFDINREIENADTATKEDTSAKIFSSMMPLLLMIFLYSGCLAIAPESIAGEKERGTIATLLVTPMKRSQLAIGKILSLGALAFLCGASSLIGTILSLPKLMGGASEFISVDIYSGLDYILLALVIFTTILFIITVISIISAFAKSVKEAATTVSPLMILVMVVGVMGMFGSGAKTEAVYYIIPLYNSIQSMNGIFSLGYSVVNVGISCLCNIIYACAGVFVLTKMFNSEKVMFSR